VRAPPPAAGGGAPPKTLSVVIPVYNEQETIREVVACAVDVGGLELDPSEFARLLAPLLSGEAEVVYGSRFLRRAPNVSLRSRVANRFLTSLTNLLFGARLTDMETAYKAFRREVLRDLRLRCVRFDFEAGITAKLLLAGRRIHEVPISYNPRSIEQGKKISWIDGVEAIYVLLKCRFLEPRSSPRRA
jgi:glycosyltransferase involved in cell wall biosynthesis